MKTWRTEPHPTRPQAWQGEPMGRLYSSPREDFPIFFVCIPIDIGTSDPYCIQGARCLSEQIGRSSTATKDRVRVRSKFSIGALDGLGISM
jgi:hypothetical protein